MKINSSTKWIEFEPFSTEERVAKLREFIKGVYPFDFWGLTIGDFSEMLENGIPEKLKEELNKPGITVFEVVQITNACEKFITDFKNSMANLEIELDADEKQAASFMPEFTPIENMLIFTQKYFPLKDFGEAEKITILEYYLAKKAVYSNSIYQRALSKIQIKRMKNK